VQDKDRYDNVFNINGWSHQDGTVVAVKIGSFINHSCIPNLDVKFNLEENAMTVQTNRDIPAKEEVTLSYLSPEILNESVEIRQTRLKKWGFFCNCTKCQADTTLLHEASVLPSNSPEQRNDASAKLLKLGRISSSLNKKPIPSPQPLENGASGANQHANVLGSIGLTPAPLPDQTMTPAPLPDQTTAPAPLPDQTTAPIPLPNQHMAPIPLLNQQGEQLFEIRCITGARTNKKVRELLVEWQGYDPSDSTWQNREQLLSDVPHMVMAFEKEKSGSQAAAAALTPALMPPQSFLSDDYDDLPMLVEPFVDTTQVEHYGIASEADGSSSDGSSSDGSSSDDNGDHPMLGEPESAVAASESDESSESDEASESDESSGEEFGNAMNKIPRRPPVRQHSGTGGSTFAMKTRKSTSSNKHLVASPETQFLRQTRPAATSVASSHDFRANSAMRKPRVVMPFPPEMLERSLGNKLSKTSAADAGKRYETQSELREISRNLKRHQRDLDEHRQQRSRHSYN